MGLFSSGGTKLPKWAKPYAQAGLAEAGSVYNANKDNLSALSDVTSQAALGAAGNYETSPFVDNAQGAARAISNGFFLGQNPGQNTYDRLQQTGAGMSPGVRSGGGGLLGGDPSMGLLSRMATDMSPGAGTSLIRASANGRNTGDDFAAATAQGAYLNRQPSAGLYGEMMDRSYSTSNPFIDDIIRQNDENVTTQANRLFGSRGMGAGIGSAFADVLSRNLADTGGQIRYQNYNDAEARRLQAGGQSDAAFSAERGRMMDGAGMLSSNFNAGQDRVLAAGQALNANDVAGGAQRLSAAQSLGGQYGDNQDRALARYSGDQDRSLARYSGDQDRSLSAATASDASQNASIAQILQALSMTGELESSRYAGYGPTTDLLKTAATLPYAGLDAYQTALSNLLGQSKVTKGPGIGGALIGAGAELGSAAIKASDRRLKVNIEQIGVLEDGLGVYTYDYIDPVYGEGRQRGVMADEVAVLRPWALGPEMDGYQTVNYGEL